MYHTYTVDVITPTVAGREHLLADAVASVELQTYTPVRHIIGVDTGGRPDACRNALVQQSSADWIAFLDDDDILYPEHINKLMLAALNEGASMAYSRCDYPPGLGLDRYAVEPFDERKLRGANYIPITVLMWRQAFLDVGMFRTPDQFAGYEDWFLWLDLLDHGHKFAFCPEITWLYRLHGHPWRPAWFTVLKENEDVRNTFRRTMGIESASPGGDTICGPTP